MSYLSSTLGHSPCGVCYFKTSGAHRCSRLLWALPIGRVLFYKEDAHLALYTCIIRLHLGHNTPESRLKFKKLWGTMLRMVHCFSALHWLWWCKIEMEFE